MDPIHQKLWPDIIQEAESDGINRVKSDKYYVYMMDYDYYMANFRVTTEREQTNHSNKYIYPKFT